MARSFLSAIILAAFFLRDLRLLASAGPTGIARASAIYCLSSGAYSALLAVGFTLAGVGRPDMISLSRSEWLGLIALHIGLWGITWALSSTSLRNRAWLLALVPSPATLVSQCLLVGLLPDTMVIALGLLSIFLFCVIWNALIIPLAYELSGGLAGERGASMQSLELAGCLNLFSILYVLDPTWGWLYTASR